MSMPDFVKKYAHQKAFEFLLLLAEFLSLFSQSVKQEWINRNRFNNTNSQ